MMLPEMTSSARVARAFPRFARGAVVGLALGALAACGGGGSSTPTTPEMTITPVTLMPVPMEQLEAATAINAGETVEGTLESADDVKYYRLDVAETSVVEFTIDAEAGIEVALVDSNGIVLADATTASEAKVEAAVPKGTLFARVRRSPLGKLVQTVNREFAIVARVTKYVGIGKTVINLLQGRLEGELPIPGVEAVTGGTASASVSFKLTELFRRSDGGPLTFFIGGSASLVALGSVTFRIEKEELRATPGSEARPGPLVLSLCAAPADTANIPKACAPLRLTLTSGDPLLRRKPSVPAISDIHWIDAGGTFTSEPVGSYFEYAEGATVRFTRMERSSIGEGWGHDLVDGRLQVSSTSDMVVGNNIVVRLTIVDSTDSEDTRTAWVDFRVGIEPEEEEEEEPGGVGVPVAPSPETPQVPTFACLSLAIGPYGTCTEEPRSAGERFNPTTRETVFVGCTLGEQHVGQTCPRTGSAELITSCRFERRQQYQYFLNTPGAVEAQRSACEGAGGAFTVHKGS